MMYAHDGRKTLLIKEYEMDELSDLGRDIYESIDPTLNGKAKVINDDLAQGTLVVQVIYKTKDCCNCQGFHHQTHCPHHVMVY